MKGYRFRLAPVLQVRRREEESARGDLLRATAAVTEQERLLAERTARYTEAGNPQGTLSTADLLCDHAHRSVLGAALIAQRSNVRQAQELAEQARAAWSAAAVKVGALERLDERQRAEHEERARKQDDLATDELVVSRYGRTER